MSSGSDERFCSEGYCRYAVTPRGAYSVYRVASGWETGPLGDLYNPLYFNGGIAFHGAYSVPGYPASHGCVRIPMNAAEWFPDDGGHRAGRCSCPTAWATRSSPRSPRRRPSRMAPGPTITLPSALPSRRREAGYAAGQPCRYCRWSWP